MPAITPFILTAKRALTHDVFELTFTSEAPTCNPGQFILFTLPSGLKRAYSVAWQSGKEWIFIIKRLEDGKGGSKEICDLPLNISITGLGPTGHFVVSENPDMARCFLGTGTGFAPLYFQIKALLEKNPLSRITFVFGVRNLADIFYTEEIQALQKNAPNLVYIPYLSRENAEGYTQGYVIDFLPNINTDTYDEFLLCGSPAMVNDARRILAEKSIEADRVRFEQY